jgi:non-specific serine/threonine protein kinase
MRNAIAWSYDLLDESEQNLFGRLSVFVGGFQLDAVEEICGLLWEEGLPWTIDRAQSLDGSPPVVTSVLERIVSMVEKSLLRQVGGPQDEQPRYQMLETVREYALERLRESAEEQAVRAAHATWILGVAERAYEHLYFSDLEQVLVRLDPEHDNVRAALAWSEVNGEVEISLRLAHAMSTYWSVRGYYPEGRGWLERAIAHGECAPVAARIRALLAAGWMARSMDDSGAAERFQAEAMDLARVTADQESIARALQAMGQVDLQRGDFERAAARTEEALTLFQKLDDTPTAGPQSISVLYANLGQIALARGDETAATAYLEEALRRQRELGFAWGIGDTLRYLGDLARDRGDYEQALDAYRESVEQTRHHGDRRFLAETLVGIAGLANDQSQPELAARFYGAAATLHEQIGAPIEAWERAAYERGLAAVRAALSPEVFEAAWTAGSNLPLSAVIAEAIADPDSSSSPASARSAEDSAVVSGLTTRECDVLRLLAEGHSDREIAKALSISPRTVGGHVTHLLTKFDVESRTAAVAFAVRHGLV